MDYFVIMPSEDGARVYQYSKKELEKAIAEEIEDEIDIEIDGYRYLQNALEEIPRDEHSVISSAETDPDYWKGPLIIKGEIVKPKAKKVVQQWEIE
jgi:hypothetical protein